MITFFQKEIKLTQDIIKLLAHYQIPSDFLSFSNCEKQTTGEHSQPTSSERLETVRSHVKAMYNMIRQTQGQELLESEQEEKKVCPVPPVIGVPTRCNSSRISLILYKWDAQSPIQLSHCEDQS